MLREELATFPKLAVHLWLQIASLCSHPVPVTSVVDGYRVIAEQKTQLVEAKMEDTRS